MSRFQSIASVITALVLLVLSVMTLLGNVGPARALPPSVHVISPSDIIDTVAGNGSSDYGGDGGSAIVAGLSVQDVALDKWGNIFICDWDNHVIRVVSNYWGTISTIAGNASLGAGSSGDGGPATSATLDYPMGVAVDSRGNIYITEWKGDHVRVVDASTGNISMFLDGLGTPTYVAVDSHDNAYISDENRNVVIKVNTSTGVPSTIAGNGVAGYSGDGGPATSAQLDGPTGLAVDSKDNIYIGDFRNHVIRMVNASTSNISTVAGNRSLGFGYSGDGGPATSAQLNYPEDVDIDGNGNIYFTDVGNSVIRMVNASTGNISTVAGNRSLGFGYSGDGGPAISARLYCPRGVAVDKSNGILYIGDTENSRVRMMPYYSTAEISVVGNSVEIAAGDSSPNTSDGTNFGAADVLGGTVVKTFTIKNTGVMTLALRNSSPYITIGGANASDFSVTAIPESSIPWYGNTTFNITFNPSGNGVRSAIISIANSDTDENPYNFSIQGTGCDKALPLKDGWTLISTDKWINSSSSSWLGRTPLVYKYNSSTGFLSASLSDLKPVDALYVKMTGGGWAVLNYSDGAPGVSVKDLTAGWNLISSATDDNASAVLSPLRYVQVGQEQGSGLTTLVCQGTYRVFGTNSLYLATLTDADWTALAGIPMSPFEGYWVYLNAAKTFGVVPR